MNHGDYIIGSTGRQFRNNGFRKCEVIDSFIAKYIIDNISEIEHSNKSIWEYINGI